MPHSVSPEPKDPSQDVDMQDAPNTSMDEDISQSNAAPSSEPSQQENGNVKEEDAKPDAPSGRHPIEDMFDDDEEDEFMGSSAPETSIGTLGDNYSDPGVMRAFYQRLFPYRHVFLWLNHSPKPKNDFGNREFAFTLPNDVYLRYQSFPTHDQFRQQCLAQIPSRFEIGPVYSTNPRERKQFRGGGRNAFRPISKELVFDIDMTDYDEIRTCCSKAQICKKCWTFMQMAIKVIDAALREDFGFKHILWVFSGRRGVHAWVCDRRARELDDGKRRAIASYMELIKGGEGTKKKVNLKRPLHPHIERSLALLRSHFESDTLRTMDPFSHPQQSEHLLSLLSGTSRALSSSLAQKWSATPSRSSASKWSDIDALASSGDIADLDTRRLRSDKQDILLEYTYPRIDANVSKHLNHLLKSPFCVHPGTGRVCVPIDGRRVEDFDPMTVPTVTDLLGEVDRWEGKSRANENQNGRSIPDWEKTSLKPYVDYFRGFVTTLLKDEARLDKEKLSGAEAAATRKRAAAQEGPESMEF